MSNKLLFILLILLSFNYSNAQYYESYHEVGIAAGPVFFQGDYGERGDTENFIKNNGFTVGGFYYLSFINFGHLRENFKIRLEASFMKSELQHYGKYVAPEKTSLFAQQLRAMSGSTQTTSIGFQIEYYPWKLDDYNRARFSPFVSLGGHFGSFTTKANSSLGPLGTTITTPDKYLNGFKNGSGTVASVTAGLGARYKLAPYHALVADVRWQQYFSDWVDGLNPNKEIYTENKANDYSFALTFGYIYYFN